MRHSRGGAGRARAGRGGTSASGAGCCRAEPIGAEPSRAELRGAGERQAEPAGGSARFVLRFPARCPPRLCPDTGKTFIVSGTPPPWMCDEIATLRCLVPQARLQRRSRRERATLAAGLLRPALPHLPIAPGNREAGGGPPKGPRGHRYPEILFSVADLLGATLT